MNSKIELQEGEYVVMSSNQDILTLTNKRIRYTSATAGNTHQIGITLDSVSSCGITTQSYPLLLVIDVLALLGAIYFHEYRNFLVLSAAVLIASFFFTYKSVISIASNGGDRIIVPVTGMTKSKMSSFLEAIEREKLKLGNKHNLIVT